MFLNGISQITVGNTAAAEARFFLKTADYSTPTVTWEVLDQTGAVYNSGEASSVSAQPSATIVGQTDVVVAAEIAIPGNISIDVPTGMQVRWTLVYGNAQPLQSMEHFTLLPRMLEDTGPSSSVSLIGESVQMSLTLPTEFTKFRADLYFDNALQESVEPSVVALDGAQKVLATFSGNYQRGASLSPYTLIWRYGDNDSMPNMEHANLWLVNPTIIGAQSEVRQFLLKAYSDTEANAAQLQPEDLLLALQQGCEMFNASGYPTEFTMIRASGPIRALWLRYALIAACRSQYLTEGMKAFNFTGQQTNLDVDRSQFWDTMASQLQQEVDQAIKPFKENLVRRGLTGGDGNISSLGLKFGAIGAIGISMHPMSPMRGGGSLIRRLG